MRPTVILLLLLIAPGGTAPAGGVSEETVREVAAQLRCVVCQNLSVADSPSAMAKQMRRIIRERLAAGESPDDVMAYFVEKYGEWVLLAPRPQGFNLLVWIMPFATIALGMGVIAVITWRWARRSGSQVPSETVDPAVRDRISRELSELDG